jgi:hypothetical protein
MDERQKQVLDAFDRVRAFVGEHPVEGTPSYGGAVATLDEVVPQLREYAGLELAGHQLRQVESRRQAEMIARIRTDHLRTIVGIAKTQIEPDAEKRLPAAFRMPSVNIRATRMLQVCDAMVEAAKPFEAQFVSAGLAPDFLAQLQAARDELAAALHGRARQVGTHVGARKGLEVQLGRGRRAVDRLDAVVRTRFASDPTVLAKWRAAKRVHLVRGASVPREVSPSSPEMAVAA